MNNKYKFLLILLLAFSSIEDGLSAQRRDSSSPKRISSQVVNLGKVYPIYMVSGLATLIEIPGVVTGIRTGNPDAIHYFRPDKPENEVTVVLKSAGVKPTNLIIRSGKQKFIFDIVPSKIIHQDSIEVVGSFGGAEFDNSGMTLIDSSEQKRVIK